MLIDYIQRFHFLVDGSPFALAAVGVLLLSLTLYFITRVRDWLILFLSAALYLVPFILRGY